MASNTVADGDRTTADRPRPSGGRQRGLLHTILSPLASLRLTVALFALAIVLIFAGTLAQVNKDIWEVMNLYFRAWVAWIPLQIFFPPVFFPRLGPVSGGFYFPGGFLIASAMAVNLLAAHGVRFTVQARGARLAAGLAVLALGVLVTWLVVLGGSDKEIVEGSVGLNVSWLWGGVEAALGMLWLSLLYGIWEVGAARRWERRLLIAAGAIIGIVLGFVLYNGPAVMPDPSAMRILWQLVKATSAAVVLLAGCILVFRKRAGIVLLHAGVGLMMVNELVVYSLHSEGIMPLAEGERLNYAQDVRTVELAVTSPAEKPDAGKNQADAADGPEGTLENVTVVRPRWSEAASVIRSPLLPFDVEVLKYFPNSMLREARDKDENLATSGAGKHLVPTSLPAGSGTDTDQKVDLASAYIKLLAKGSGEPIGTYLVSGFLQPQSVEVDGKPYSISLRFKRDYKPYIVELADVRKEDYLGTNTPRNYSSDVRIIDPVHHVDRQIHIWMNNPLRYAGDTLYQSGYHPGPPETTTLQVVKNTGWMIPYVGCMIVATGMLAHFSLTLVRFLRRRDAEELIVDKHLTPSEAARAVEKPRRKAPAGATGPRSLWRGMVIPAAVVVVLGGWLASQARQPAPVKDGFNFYEFGKLPLVYEGRTK
ncbi:MAG TPA: cytochrome c biogenesis protein ResB, partial [Pirellulales bacterium]